MDNAIRDHIDGHLDETLEDLKRLTAQPSVSAKKLGILECAEMVAEELTNAGLKAEIMPTANPAYPVVYGEAEGTSDQTLLFYNHYDVQPAEPLELWETPPFEPTERDGHIYGRGISDDKGHLMARLAAIKAIRSAKNELPARIKFLIEGAEEIGSLGLHDFLHQHHDKLKADVCIWEGGGVNWDGRPLLTLGVKGILYVELECVSAGTDSHSSYAPVVPNPAWRLAWALSTLKDRSERVQLRGFYDSIRAPLPEEVEALRLIPDEDERYRRDLGIEVFVQEASGYEFRRRLVMDPTCNISGFISGYTGPGSKTILPASARVKLDFRLVPDQPPEEVQAALRSHLDEHGFNDITITTFGMEHPARTPIGDPWVGLVAETARTVYGSEPYIQPNMAGTGPQYPVQEVLGVPVASCGIDYPGNRIHAPNENIRRDYFRLGVLHTAELIEQFGAQFGR